ncbi:hypothetical protein SB660_19960, partial [Bacillus sp. SIMBA_005]
IKRAEHHSCPVVLGSATPTLESYARAQKGVYELLSLKHRVNHRFDFSSIGLKEFGRLDISSAAAIWSVEIALVIGIITTILFDWRSVFAQLK